MFRTLQCQPHVENTALSRHPFLSFWEVWRCASNYHTERRCNFNLKKCTMLLTVFKQFITTHIMSFGSDIYASLLFFFLAHTFDWLFKMWKVRQNWVHCGDNIEKITSESISLKSTSLISHHTHECETSCNFQKKQTCVRWSFMSSMKCCCTSTWS